MEYPEGGSARRGARDFASNRPTPTQKQALIRARLYATCFTCYTPPLLTVQNGALRRVVYCDANTDSLVLLLVVVVIRLGVGVDEVRRVVVVFLIVVIVVVRLECVIEERAFSSTLLDTRVDGELLRRRWCGTGGFRGAHSHAAHAANRAGARQIAAI